MKLLELLPLKDRTFITNPDICKGGHEFITSIHGHFYKIDEFGERDFHLTNGDFERDDWKIVKALPTELDKSYRLYNALDVNTEMKVYSTLRQLEMMRDTYNTFYEKKKLIREPDQYYSIVVDNHKELTIADRAIRPRIFTFKTRPLAEQFLRNFEEELKLLSLVNLI